jgi:sulfide:quinone oxidoreductase
MSLSAPPVPTPAPGFSVVIAGGGVAALESAAALATLAGDRIAITLVTPDKEFVYHPLTSHQSWASPVPLARVATSLRARLIAGRIGWVERHAHRLHTASGASVTYDALLLEPGAVSRPCIEHAITLDGRASGQLTQLADDLRTGRVNRLAFVVPERMAWPLPLYEMALSAATEATDRGLEVELTVVTAEHAPLQIFGAPASAWIAELLSERGVAIVCDAQCEVPAPGAITVTTDVHSGHAPRHRDLSVQRVVALPEVLGPHLRGIPCAADGFIPIDRFCRVAGTSSIYAAGDATDYPVRCGEIASQQADVAATSIAAAAGAEITMHPFRPMLRGVLLTGREARHLSARLTGGAPFSSQLTTPATGAAPPPIAARYLAHVLEQIEQIRC